MAGSRVGAGNLSPAAYVKAAQLGQKISMGLEAAYQVRCYTCVSTVAVCACVRACILIVRDLFILVYKGILPMKSH